MYEELVKRLRHDSESRALMVDAADAIEELSMKLHGDEAAILGMKREIERMVRAEKPLWIPVTEQNHPKACEPVMVVYIGWNDALPHRDCTAYWSEDKDEWRWAETNDKVKVPITHYMSLPSLPEPPEEEGPNFCADCLWYEPEQMYCFRQGNHSYDNGNCELWEPKAQPPKEET